MPVTINGDGSITGLSVGGLPEWCCKCRYTSNWSVTSAKLNLLIQWQTKVVSGSIIQVVSGHTFMEKGLRM